MTSENKNGKISLVTTQNKEYKIANNSNYGDKYWDEGITFYPEFRRRFSNIKKKRLRKIQVRMYKTWKHNRLKQYKGDR